MLKNLAAVLAEEAGSAAEALRLYGEAVQLDAGDIVLWNRMGTLVRKQYMTYFKTHFRAFGPASLSPRF